MRKIVVAAAISAGAFMCTLSAAGAGTVIPIPQVPGSTATYVNGINDDNLITGDYTTSDGAQHGFVGTSNGNYTTFDLPGGGTVVFAAGINNQGFVTAFSNFQTQDCQFYGCEYLRWPDGSAHPITKGGTDLDGVPWGIIPHRRFVGQYSVYSNNRFYRYGYYGKGDRYRAALTLPFNTDWTSPRGYREDGTVVGYYRDLNNASHDFPAFVLQNGTVTNLRYPDPAAYETFFEDINNNGIVAGYWINQDDTVEQGFLYDTQSATFSPLSVPGASLTEVRAINRHGVVTVEADNLPYIYCIHKKGCPLSPAKGISIPEKWIRAPAANIRTVLCKNGCIGPFHESVGVKPADAAAVRAAVQRDPDLHLEGHLFRR